MSGKAVKTTQALFLNCCELALLLYTASQSVPTLQLTGNMRRKPAQVPRGCGLVRGLGSGHSASSSCSTQSAVGSLALVFGSDKDADGASSRPPPDLDDLQFAFEDAEVRLYLCVLLCIRPSILILPLWSYGPCCCCCVRLQARQESPERLDDTLEDFGIELQPPTARAEMVCLCVSDIVSKPLQLQLISCVESWCRVVIWPCNGNIHTLLMLARITSPPPPLFRWLSRVMTPPPRPPIQVLMLMLSHVMTPPPPAPCPPIQVLTRLTREAQDRGHQALTLQLTAQALARRGFEVAVRTASRHPSCKDTVQMLYNRPHQFLVVKPRPSDDSEGEQGRGSILSHLAQNPEPQTLAWASLAMSTSQQWGWGQSGI